MNMDKKQYKKFAAAHAPNSPSAKNCLWAFSVGGGICAFAELLHYVFMRFLELVNHPQGMNIGMRHITLSTCGITERFDDLAERDLQITLAVSLHAPDDETRSRIMPANRGRGVEELMRCCRRYYERTGRRITFEYAMIDGVNDTEYHAKLLAKHAKSVGAHINLIPLNHVEEREFKPSTPEHLKAFIKILEDAGISVTVRRKLGSDVDASCGQLRRKMQKKDASGVS